ncbi:MAG: hypothetical protein WC223_07935 [Bacteroidales bacterium]|jgi:hypothetical protein
MFKVYSKYFIIILFILGITHICFSQELKNYEVLKLGDESFNNGDYYAAIYYYDMYIKKDSSWIVPFKRYAEVSRLGNDYIVAEKLYKYVIEKDTAGKYPESLYWYAQMLKSNGKYETAKLEFIKYYEKNKNNKEHLVENSKMEIDACDSAIKYLKNPQPYIISHLDGNINTPYSEFGAFQLNDTTLEFSSLRPESNENNFSTGYSKDYIKIYKSTYHLVNWNVAEELDDNKINNKVDNNANITYEPKTLRIFFTRCNKTNTSKFICEIYYCDYKNGKWLPPMRLSDNVNSKGYTATQPSAVNTDKGYVLYFVSDRPGGEGGMDIWHTIISKKGECSEPVNLGKTINTPDDEITPFYNGTTETLYFSSNGHKGMGNLDVYEAKGSLTKWNEPKNMESPINTSYNDFYFIVYKNDTSGYFTSNRPGSYFIKGETCCYDIYKWEKKIIKKVEVDTVKKNTVVTVIEDTIKIEKRIVDLLPLTLYFHNDEPDKKTWVNTTNKDYETTYKDYIALIPKYKKEYSAGLDSINKVKAEKDIDDFFTEYVEKGYSKLNLFCELLLKDLKTGKTCKVTVKGYCSPLTTNEYNKHLAKRRISSLINYLYIYKNGVFVKYMNDKAENGGKIQFIEEPIGEEAAPKNVSDNYYDTKNSIYNPKASFERKIKILYYSSGD